MKKKLFISLPMTGMENTVKKRYSEALEEISHNEKIKDYEMVIPVDLNTSFDDNGLTESAKEHDVAYWMGKDVELLMRCDAIFSCKGWESSKGCNVERFVAQTYGLEIYDSND